MTEQFANLAQSTLSSAISAKQTTITVVDASAFPLQGNFRIVAQSYDSTTNTPVSAPEIMLVTAVAGNQFTVQRAAESASLFPAIAFASGAQVSHISTAAVMRLFLQNITALIQAGTNVSISGSGTSGSPYVISASGGGGSSGFTVTVETADFSVSSTSTPTVYVVRKAVGAATSVTLPASPSSGQVACIKDGKGDAATNNITVSGNGNNIDAGASYVIGSNYGSAMLAWDGAQWNIIA